MKKIKKERFYVFKVSDGSKLHSAATSKPHAIKKAKNWEKWVAKRGFPGLKTKYIGLESRYTTKKKK